MEIEFRKFCNEYAEQLEPFSKELLNAVDTLANVDTQPAPKQTRMRLQEIRFRADALSEKIAQQQTYLLIFGPLKSGKSTLMNAMSGSYVSEVSSLPAYPALVYVKHGEQRRFEATTYEGNKIQFADGPEMSAAVLKGHEELARKILETERSGETFDPQENYPQAIRRMDVEMPAKSLAESGAALVDTPGLYTRMRFGYDLLTRDFRDTAACAIFVVKSDNLFFEKVFEEFNQLLGHFSRIFLVVNIDSSKRDLRADGSLEPSIESSRPEAIVEAFQSLAMSAPLREAYEQGNLNVYTIDLLAAASAQLRKEAGTDDAATPTDDQLQRFLDDLTEYLNSSDYLNEFIYDSLRQGENLQSEVTSVVAEEVNPALKRDASHWNDQKAQAEAKLAASDTLEKIDWKVAFGKVQQEKARLLQEYAAQRWSKLSEPLEQALNDWLDSDDSLEALQDDYLNQLIKKKTANDAQAILNHLRELLDTETGGAQFNVSESQALSKTGMQGGQNKSKLLQELSSREALQSQPLRLKPDDIALKSQFSDYLMFRNKDSVKQRFFGPDRDAVIPTAAKRKRIGDQELQPLRDKVNAYLQTELPRIHEEYVDRILNAYAEQFGHSINSQNAELRSNWLQQKADCEARLAANHKQQHVFDSLAGVNESFAKAVHDLMHRYSALPAPAETDASEDEAALNV